MFRFKHLRFKHLNGFILENPELCTTLFNKPLSELKLSDIRNLRQFFRTVIGSSISVQELLNILGKREQEQKEGPLKKVVSAKSSDHPKTNTNLSVLMPGAELGQAKAGGLAEVMDNLPQALKSAGVRVIVVTPGHGQIGDEIFLKKENTTYNLPNPIRRSAHLLEKGISERKKQSWFWDKMFSSKFEGVRSEGLYSATGSERLEEAQYWTYQGDIFASTETVYAGHEDDPYRYMEFNQAVSLLAASLNQALDGPHKIDLIHGHDWHTGWIPVILHIWKAALPRLNLSDIPFAFTVHNAGLSSGIHPAVFKTALGLMGSEFEYFYNPEDWKGCYHYGKMDPFISALKLGDITNVVSETYLSELLDGAVPTAYQQSFRFIHEQNKLRAIMNGASPGYHPRFWDSTVADEILWDGKSENFLPWKSKLKTYVQREFALEENPDALLISMIGRVTEQKGQEFAADLLFHRMERGDAVQALLVIPNAGYYGDQRILGKMRELEKRYPRQIRLVVFSERNAKLLYGASDLHLMPSQYEPCGLVQLNGFQCGTLTLARKTGGLADSIIHEKTGYLFDALWPVWGDQIRYEYFMREFNKGMDWALNTYSNKTLWQDLVMKTYVHSKNFSWANVALKYINMYEAALRRKSSAT